MFLQFITILILKFGRQKIRFMSCRKQFYYAKLFKLVYPTLYETGEPQDKNIGSLIILPRYYNTETYSNTFT